MARQRDILAVGDIGLEDSRLGNIERPQSRPLVSGQRELIDDGNAQAVRDQSANS
jgi:hypothetical protein